MTPTNLQIDEIRSTAKNLYDARISMLKHALLIDGSSYDRQLKGLTSRCTKAATQLTVELVKARAGDANDSI